MDLKSGATYWTRRQPAAPAGRIPPKNLRCDVAILGAGISGALIAHAFLEAGARVAMIDKRPVATGSTAASTALLLYQTDLSLGELARRHGAARAIRVYRLGRRAIREIARIAGRFRIDCGFRKRDVLYLASSRAAAARLKAEYRRLRRAGFAARWLDRAALGRRFGIDRPAALHSPGAAEMDPVAFTRGLVRAGRRTGRLEFYRGSVASVESSDSEVRLRLGRGRLVTAAHAVLAPGYEASPFLKAGAVVLRSTYVLATAPLSSAPAWPGECLIWETARPYLYLRTTSDHRILVGGGDEVFRGPRRRDACLARKRRYLEARFRKLFPQVPIRAEMTWAGTFADTPDGLPLIGEFGGKDRIHYALGYGGNGITLSQVAAGLIRDHCLGRRNPDQKIFRFGRLRRPRRSPTRLSENRRE